MNSRVLAVSVSGGRTSAYMARMIQQSTKLGSDYEKIIYMFANTGSEDEDTLRYLNDVDIKFGLNIIWVEAVVHPGRKGSTHKIVTYETASRDNEPFKAVIAKYGIPNVSFIHCTRELKTNPMDSLLKSMGVPKAHRAIGIREDENRRVSPNATKNHIVYPLVDWWPTDKQDVLDYWKQYNWDLAIPEWRGNCKTCYKKTTLKLLQVWRETPEAFEFTDEMEQLHGRTGTQFLKHPDSATRVFFRGNQSTRQLVETFKIMPDDAMPRMSDNDASNTCSESCEIYPTEFLTTNQ